MNHALNDPNWYQVSNIESVPTPALLIYEERVRENIRRMISIAGDVDRLRPHIKTHKLGEVVKLQIEQGITRFKCATIAEAEMLATAGAKDVLVAYQPTGPGPVRLRKLVEAYPNVLFGTVVDSPRVVRSLAETFCGSPNKLAVYLDVDCGMHRTGILPGQDAEDLYASLFGVEGIRPAGLHAYDGHIHDPDPAQREAACRSAFEAVRAFRSRLTQRGLSVPSVIAGGTPTFPFHAQDSSVECSPGTCVLWDFGYGDKFLDMPFLVAALVAARVVSKPSALRLCLDLGHKAIAAENPQPRARIIGLEDSNPVMHSEEHLVLETKGAGQWELGDVLYAIPRHICPTVALHSEAYWVSQNTVRETVKIVARSRVISI